MAWQLKAARRQQAYRESTGQWTPGARTVSVGEDLVKRAEALYELAADDSLWPDD